MENKETPKKKPGRPKKKVVEKKDDVNLQEVLKQVEELRKAREKDQAKIKMLEAVADKGRVFNYENAQKAKGKKPMKVKLSTYMGGIIIMWRTIKDELVKHPTTGRIVGENQEYEVVLRMENGDIKKHRIEGYPAFTSARYDEKEEYNVIGKSEDFEGNVKYTVELPGGQHIDVDARFVN